MDHTTHEPAKHTHGAASWGTAVKATLHCLTGCAIGEILGMVIGTALGWGNLPTMVLAIGLAFLFGYSFTLFAVLRAGLGLGAAIKVALAADTVSITVMEFVDNAIIALTPGALDAHLTDTLFWSALLGGFAVAFVITTPVNKWMIGRGRGHAVVHAHH
ncbi:DUF4396 domain-containing protein [Streptomyces sp. SudanB52_2052]|uniref:DUF4396 domain-containing protein n=1 Tax=Streptomyces sp. SudanB52_2052 TaxID=3035276 RepID=UPI003F55B2BE